MNRTNFEHAFYALLMQLPFGLFGYWWMGAAFGAAFFIGREFAQAEYRYIKANGGDRYATPMPAEFAVFHTKWWNLDSVLDFLFPVVAVIAAALAANTWITYRVG